MLSVKDRIIKTIELKSDLRGIEIQRIGINVFFAFTVKIRP